MIRILSGIAVLLAVFSLVAAAVPNEAAAGKSYQTALPQYVQGYWPGQDPALCIIDQTGGKYPVAAAAAEFEPVVGITVTAVTDVVDCGIDDVPISVVESTNPRCGDHDACWMRADGTDVDRDGMFVHEGGYIALDRAGDVGAGRWRVLIVHEIGHALGLDHTNRRDSVMRTPLLSSIDGLTGTDVAVLNQLYS